MLRIVFSRAMFFPWLGFTLMATGAFFPDRNTVGSILIVIGANLAFYSLHDFSQNFAWGSDSRPMLSLCGVAFLIGLAILASSTLQEGFNPWLALLCMGLYLCIFAVWTIQQPVSWPFRILAVLGSLLMVLGSIFGHLGWWDWQVFAESEEKPQEIALRDLLQKGFGSNRYVRLKEFRFCDQFAIEKQEKASKIQILWIPVVAVDGQEIKRNEPAPTVPPRLTVVCGYFSLVGADNRNPRKVGQEGLEVRLRLAKEVQGYECTVVPGNKKLKPEVQEQLNLLAPQTNWEEVVVLDWCKPPTAEQIYGCLVGGGTGLLLGLASLCVVYVRAWRVVGVESPQLSVEEATEESVGAEQVGPNAEPNPHS